MDKFVADNLREIDYSGPISVARLFEGDMLKYTISHVFSKFIDQVNEARKSKIDYLEPVVFNATHNVFLVEYSFLIDCFTDLVSHKEMFKNDYALNFDDTKNSEFLIVSLMEDYLKLLKMNSRKMNAFRKSEVNYTPSIFKQLIIRYESFEDDDVHHAQMNAVIFSANSVKKLISGELFLALSNCVNGSSYSQVLGVFGRKACNEFWANSNKKSQLYSQV